MGSHRAPQGPRGRERAAGEPGPRPAESDRERRLVHHAGRRDGQRGGRGRLRRGERGVQHRRRHVAALHLPTAPDRRYAGHDRLRPRDGRRRATCPQPVSTTIKIDRTPPNSHVAGGAGPGALVAKVTTDAAGNQVVVLAGAISDNLSGRAGIGSRKKARTGARTRRSVPGIPCPTLRSR